VVFGLGKKALDHLAQNLGQAHAAAHPQESARASLLGWVESAGPVPQGTSPATRAAGAEPPLGTGNWGGAARMP
jgi:hypothetical protein